MNQYEKKILEDIIPDIKLSIKNTDKVFIGLLSFYKHKNSEFSPNPIMKELTEEEVLKEFPTLDKNDNRSVLAYDWVQYPAPEEFKNDYLRIKWSKICSKFNLEKIELLYLILCTLNQSISSEFVESKVIEKFNQKIELEKICSPVEGSLDYYAKADIFKILKSITSDDSELRIIDEFGDNERHILFSQIENEIEFINIIEHNDYYLELDIPRITIAIGWDDFHYKIFCESERIIKLIQDSEIEGFLTNMDFNEVWYKI